MSSIHPETHLICLAHSEAVERGCRVTWGGLLLAGIVVGSQLSVLYMSE